MPGAEIARRTSERFGKIPAVGACEPFHEESLALGEEEFRVFRCSWGWCVKRGEQAYRSRLLLDACEEAWGARLDEPAVRTLVGAIERALEAEYAHRDATASTVVTLPDAPG